MDMKIPFLGDGIQSAIVLSVLVNEGDMVQKDQVLLELETDKAVAPVSALYSGKIIRLLVKVGDKVSSGTLFAHCESEKEEIPESLIDTPVPAPARVDQARAAQPILEGNLNYQILPGAHATTSPSIKQFASLFGLDLQRVQGSGDNGRITHHDIRSYIQFLQGKAFSVEEKQSEVLKKQQPSVDFSKWGSIEEKKLSGLRQKISEKMQMSWQTVPHVTQFDEADISRVTALRKQYAPQYEKKGMKLTLTVFVMRAVDAALRQFPNFNSSYDEQKQILILKQYIHLGIAVDTENGLIVPVIREVDKKSMEILSRELAEIAQKARERKVSVEELQGGSFTISNLGGLGVGPFTPIVNTPEVAILGLSTGVMRPVLNEEKVFEPRMMMPLSLSYDHRVIDGADGARFLRYLINTLENFDESLLNVDLK